MANLLDTLDPIFADCLLKPWQASESRYEIAVPWVAEGWAYGTNGRIAVRQPVRRKNSNGHFPSGKSLFEAIAPKAGVIIVLPRSGRKQSDLVHCPNCRGRKQGCSCTNGKVVRKTKSIGLGCGEYGLADRYLWLLRDHGITTVQPTTRSDCYSFTKGQIEGRLMGQLLEDRRCLDEDS